jgi:hypothetical protein
VPQFNIIDGKWIPNERQLPSDANGELDDYCETFYPYNFLWMLGGEGMVIIHAPDFAIHAPLRQPLVHTELPAGVKPILG